MHFQANYFLHICEHCVNVNYREKFRVLCNFLLFEICRTSKEKEDEEEEAKKFEIVSLELRERSTDGCETDGGHNRYIHDIHEEFFHLCSRTI